VIRESSLSARETVVGETFTTAAISVMVIFIGKARYGESRVRKKRGGIRVILMLTFAQRGYCILKGYLSGGCQRFCANVRTTNVSHFFVLSNARFSAPSSSTTWGDHRIRSIKHGKGCNDHSMKRRRTRTRLQLVPETTGDRLVCGKELLFSWRCSHSRFTTETSSLPCFRYRILPSRHYLSLSCSLFVTFIEMFEQGFLGSFRCHFERSV
jgi:hypothetical protein